MVCDDCPPGKRCPYLMEYERRDPAHHRDHVRDEGRQKDGQHPERRRAALGLLPDYGEAGG
jgi:hypothetical protein